MKKLYNDERLMIRAADMFYKQNLTLAQIAQALGVSRPTLAKLLESAREAGIVKITISNLNGRNYYEYENKLESKFGLKEVIITDTDEDYLVQRDLCAKAASIYLDRILKEGSVVGVGMGVVINRMVAHLAPSKKYQNLLFVPLVGGLGTVETEIHSNYLSEEMRKAYGGKSLSLYAPARVEHTQTKVELMKEASIRSVLDQAPKVDIAITSLGVSEHSYPTVVRNLYFSDPDVLQKMMNQDIAGDLCLQCFDQQGRLEPFEFNQTVIAVDIRKLQHIPYSIILAGGAHKARAIRAAIAGGFLNVLITDKKCAERLLTD